MISRTKPKSSSNCNISTSNLLLNFFNNLVNSFHHWINFLCIGNEKK